ncbi:MAG: hypothetical protein HY553_07145 [Elusimicrobia bacterium]|nr:hypothetical protein [Elusimicrobiota bacterium]
MLREIGAPTRDQSGRVRRTYADAEFELYVLVEPDGCMFGFQVVYRSGSRLRMLSWTPVEEYLHFDVETADESAVQRRYVRTDPGACDAAALLARLRAAAQAVEPRVQSFVFELLHSHASDVHRCRYCAARRKCDWHCPRCWIRACDGCMREKALRKSRCTWTEASHEWAPDLAPVSGAFPPSR